MFTSPPALERLNLTLPMAEGDVERGQTDVNVDGEGSNDPLEKVHCLINVDNLFDIAVLVFEALVGVLQLVDALSVHGNLFAETYCNGTKLPLAADDFQPERLCDQTAYVMDLFITIGDNFDMVVALNFLLFSVVCLIGICVMGLFVYARTFYNVLRLVLYYCLCALYLIIGVVWFLVGILLLPLFLPFMCLSNPCSVLHEWEVVFVPSRVRDNCNALLIARCFSLDEFGKILGYPYSTRSAALLRRLNFVVLFEAYVGEDPDVESLRKPEKATFLGRFFAWAQTAGEALLVNMMKFSNLLYQLSDIARDIVYLAFLSKYSTDTTLGIDLATTTLLDIVMSFLLILKLLRDLGINSNTTEELTAVRHYLAEDDKNASLNAVAKKTPEKTGPTDLVHVTLVQAAFYLILSLILNVLLCIFTVQLVWALPVFVLGYVLFVSEV